MLVLFLLHLKIFEAKMKDPNFVYQPKAKCIEIKKDKIDFSLTN